MHDEQWPWGQKNNFFFQFPSLATPINFRMETEPHVNFYLTLEMELITGPKTLSLITCIDFHKK